MKEFPLFELVAFGVVCFALGFAACYFYALYLHRAEHKYLEDVLKRSREANWRVKP